MTEGAEANRGRGFARGYDPPVVNSDGKKCQLPEGRKWVLSVCRHPGHTQAGRQIPADGDRRGGADPNLYDLPLPMRSALVTYSGSGSYTRDDTLSAAMGRLSMP